MLKLYTSQMRYSGDDKIDITVRSANSPVGKLLAPRWDMVNGFKKGNLSEDEYRHIYLAIVRNRIKKRPDRAYLITDLFKRDSVTMTCYCNAESFCHRHIAVYIVNQYANKLGVQIQNMGEH